MLFQQKQNISPGRDDKCCRQSPRGLLEDKKRVPSGENDVNHGENNEGLDCQPEQQNKVTLVLEIH